MNVNGKRREEKNQHISNDEFDGALKSVTYTHTHI